MILDRLKEALNPILRIQTGEFSSSLIVQDFDTLIGPDVDLGVNVASVLFDVFEGVTGVSVHVVVPIWSSTVGE